MAINGFDPDTSIPDLTNKVIFLTGGNQGIGQETILALAKHNPSHLFFTARSPEKAAETLSKLKSTSPTVPATVIQCDLTSLASVKSAAQSFLAQSPERLDILILNAGIMSVPPAQTKDGYEIQMGTNHIGHALLTKLLLPTLEANKSGDPRIIVLASQGFKMASSIGYHALKTDGKSRTLLGGTQMLYCETKLANVFFAQQLALHHPAITTVSVHPGIVATGLVGSQSAFQKAVIRLSTLTSGQSGGMYTPAQGAYNTLWAATVEKEKLVNGSYYEPVGKLGKLTKIAGDEKASRELWDWTEEELKGWEL